MTTKNDTFSERDVEKALAHKDDRSNENPRNPGNDAQRDDNLSNDGNPVTPEDELKESPKSDISSDGPDEGAAASGNDTTATGFRFVIVFVAVAMSLFLVSVYSHIRTASLWQLHVDRSLTRRQNTLDMVSNIIDHTAHQPTRLIRPDYHCNGHSTNHERISCD
jgi:hypothetical protein